MCIKKGWGSDKEWVGNGDKIKYLSNLVEIRIITDFFKSKIVRLVTIDTPLSHLWCGKSFCILLLLVNE